MPLLEPVPISSAELERAELVPVGSAWGVRLRFRRPVASQSTELTLDRDRLTAAGRTIVTGAEAAAGFELPVEERHPSSGGLIDEAQTLEGRHDGTGS